MLSRNAKQKRKIFNSHDEIDCFQIRRKLFHRIAHEIVFIYRFTSKTCASTKSIDLFEMSCESAQKFLIISRWVPSVTMEARVLSI